MRIKYVPEKRYIVTNIEILVESFNCEICGEWLYQYKTKCRCFDCKLDLCLKCGNDHTNHDLVLTRQALSTEIDPSDYFPDNCNVCGQVFSEKTGQVASTECAECGFYFCANCLPSCIHVL